MTYEEQMRGIHTLELKIALEIKRICEKHGIRYFLTAGTLLGAVRHGGFIPWDDDMDIGMLRSDYERFLDVCKTELGEEFFLQTWDTDDNYPFSYAKVRLRGTHFVEGFSEDVNLKENGLFVDVSPFDCVPDNEISGKVQAAKYYLCKRLLWIKKGMGKTLKSESFGKRLKYGIFLTFSCLFNYESVKRYFKKTQIRYNGKETRKVVADGSYRFQKESIEAAWVKDLSDIVFETQVFPAFRDRQSYLEHFYGDYMKLPPVEERERHLTREFRFIR